MGKDYLSGQVPSLLDLVLKGLLKTKTSGPWVSRCEPERIKTFSLFKFVELGTL